MVKRNVLKLTRKVLEQIGYSINEEKHLVTPIGHDPRELPYLTDLPYSLQHLPFRLGYGMRFFPFQNPDYHPFILAIKHAKDSAVPEKAAFTILKKYNQLLPLKTANDFLGLNADERCFPDSYHPFEYCYPWSTFTPQETKKMYLKDINHENTRHGLLTSESLELFEASDEKIRIEVTRLLALRNKIENEGFKPNIYDALGCFVLVNQSGFRWYVHGGQHRAAVLMTMGYKKAPVVVRRIIRREDARFWPNVQKGLFSQKQALTIFDALFNRQTPDITHNWINYVDANYKIVDKRDE